MPCMLPDPKPAPTSVPSSAASPAASDATSAAAPNVPADAPWTTRRLLHWTTQHFESRGIDSPRVCAEMLLGHVLGVERLRLYMEPDRPAAADERDAFRALVTRAAAHEPVDYLVGRAPFFGLELEVGPDVLIPRPSTETLVEFVLQDARTRERAARPPAAPDPAPASDANSAAPLGEAADAVPGVAPAPPFVLTLADICTGSGAIAVALTRHLPGARAVATDLSEPALAVAARNAAAAGVTDRIDFRPGDLYGPLAGERFDYLLANPPYIRDAEWADVAPNVRDHEPVSALRSGADGLDHLRPLIAGAADHLNPGGVALFEHAASHEDEVLALARAAGFADAQVLRDHERLPRVLVLTRPTGG